MLSSVTTSPCFCHIPIYSLCSTLSQLACIVYWFVSHCICFCIVQYCKGMPITSSALGAMPPSSIQTLVNYSYCIDHLLKEINVTLNLNLNLIGIQQRSRKNSCKLQNYKALKMKHDKLDIHVLVHYKYMARGEKYKCFVPLWKCSKLYFISCTTWIWWKLI